MQPGGFGGQGPGNPHGGGYPPGAPGAPGQYPGAPQAPGAPAQYGAPQAPGASPPGAPYPASPGYAGPPAGYPGAPMGAPGQYPGAPGMPPGMGAPGQYPGAPGQYPGAPGMGAQPGMPQGMAPGMGAPGYGAAMGQYGGMQMGMGAPRGNSFASAQGALASAGGMMKFMKFAFIGVGALCVLGGVALLIFVDAITGISIIFTGAVFVVVALAVLPRFTGMVGQASAMVDGFAAKEQLAQTGIPAQGRLLSVQQTGRMVNYNPEIQALVEVQHPQLGVYQTQTTAIVPQIAIPRAQPGAPVQVRVSPQNQHEIALVF